jgi:hypothetical protein
MRKRPERIVGDVARRLGLLGLIATVLVALLGVLAPAASASPTFHPQTRVAAIEQPTGQVVGLHSSVLADQGRERAPNYDRTATGSSVAAEGGAGGGAARGPSFIVHPNGEAVPVPEGATGPTPVSSGNGSQFTGGSGGSWLDSRVAGVRVMDPVTGGKYLYPNGYVSYFNEAGQTVNPFTGQTIARSDPFWHWEWSP